MRSSELFLILISSASIGGAILYGNLKRVTSISEINSIQFIEKNTGFTFKEPPHIIKGMVEEMTKFAANEWITHFGKDGLADRNYLFHQIGLLPETSIELQLGMLTSGFGYKRALYDHLSKRVIIPADFDLKNLHDKESLCEALTIALLEQHHPKDPQLSDDAFAARRMVINGQALITREEFGSYIRQQIRVTDSIEAMPIPDEIRAKVLQETKNTPSYLQYLDTSPALFGKRFLKKLHQEIDSRNEAFSLALKKAHSSLSVLTAQEAAGSKHTQNAEAIISTSVGALGLLAHASQGESIQDPYAVAKDLVSDHLLFFLDAINNQPASRIQWTLQFSSEESAIFFEKHLLLHNKNLSVNRTSGIVEASFSEIFPSHDIQ